jgi:hypothetical protein
MKTLVKTILACTLLTSGVLFFSGCDDDDEPQPQLTGDSKTYTLSSVSNPGINGTVTFAERDDDKVVITIELNGTQSGSTHPAHIHANSAAEGGGIVLDLTDVNGSDGKSETIVEALNDGTALSYEDLLAFDGYVNVHLSSSDLGTLIAQGDIGQNELTGDKKVYTLTPVADPAVTGTATFAKRQNGSTLVTVALTGTQAGADHPSHIHANTIAQGGPIVINLKNVNGTTGMAVSNVDTLNNGDPITYEQLLDFNGYLNVHTGSTFVVQGDIGGNELTGDTKEYTLMPVADPAVSGKVTFAKRRKGTTLVTIDLDGTQPGATHPTHIHENTIAEGGNIVINLKTLDGTTGLSQTSVDTLNNGTPITYDELLDFDGYLNVHTGSTFVVQGDIGQNELTGDKKEYALAELGGSGVSGTAVFEKRKNGKTQITLALTGTTAGGDHPAHIHANDAATGGGIVLDLNNVNGATGKSVTSANAMRDATEVSYDELIVYNGHINVHLSPTQLATRIAQGNIGSNAP